MCKTFDIIVDFNIDIGSSIGGCNKVAGILSNIFERANLVLK
jgi:hypothetical protein